MTTSWPVVRLGDVCDIVSGATPKTKDPSLWDGDICWVTPKDLSELEGKYIGDTPRKLTEKGLRSCSATVLPAGSVLLSSRAPIGLVAITTVPMATNQGFKSLVPEAGRADPGYLYRWLDGNRRYLQSLGRGATFTEISKAVTAEIMLPLPPIEEQRRIAALLDQADELRGKRQTSLALIDSFHESLFVHMFGAYNELPTRWPVEPLARCVLAVSDCPHSTPEWTEAGVVCLRTPNLGIGKWSWVDTRYVSEQAYQERSKRGELVKGDIVLSREGTVGIAALVPSEPRMCMGQRLVQVRPDPARTQPEYLLRYLLMALAPARIAHTMVGSTAQHLNVRELKALDVPLPPAGLQRRYSEIVRRCEVVETSHLESERLLAELMSSVQSQAFAGQL